VRMAALIRHATFLTEFFPAFVTHHHYLLSF
jgi:hypothetical protein